MLPNTLSFSPFAILTAEEMNDLVENIEALSDGSGLEDGAITPAKKTATTWEGVIDVPALSTTHSVGASFTVNSTDIPGTGNYKILIISTFEITFAGTAFEVGGEIWDSTSSVKIKDNFNTPGGAVYFGQIQVMKTVTIPAATSRTFQFRCFRTGGSGGACNNRSNFTAVLLGKA